MLSMLNQAAVEALCSATYLENYLDCMENLPDDLQRVVSQLRELDSQTNDILRDISQHQEVYLRQEDGAQKKKALIQIQRGLIKSQEIGDEKLALAALISEFIENRARQLEQDLENLDPGASQSYREEIIVPQGPKPVTVQPPTTTSTATNTITKVKVSAEEKAESLATKVKRQRRQRTHTESMSKEEEKKEDDDKPKKKKKRKVKKETKPLEHLEPIDPDEPTYCLCEQVSYGEMIGCDNDTCVIEWFHFNCVGLTHKPKGKWYCPKCRGDKPTVKRPDLK